MFKYPYIYYNFIAKYMQSNLPDNTKQIEIRNGIKKMTDEVYKEENANIIVFLIYLSKDPEIISEMLKNAQVIFGDIVVCDLDKDTEFVSKLYKVEPEVVLALEDPKEKREQFLMALDDAKLHEEENGAYIEGVASPQDQGTEELLVMNIVFKTLQILGQILRNFPGSLKGDIKLELAKECYLLGLRALKVVLNRIEAELPIAKGKIQEILKEKTDIKDLREMEDVTNEFIFQVIEILSLIFVKKISYSVGSEKLKKTYQAVLEECDTKSIGVIDIAIKLDHFRHIPQREIANLYVQAQNNTFLATLLKYLVAEHFYMYPHSFRARQRLCTKLGISIRDPKLIGHPGKLRK